MAKHLTPDERARVVARYVETANASQVAREFGISEYTVRKSAARAETLRKTDLHAQAVARAVRKARRSLARKVDTIDLYLLKHADKDDGVPSLEPKDIAALVNASAGALSRLLDADANIESKRLNRLTRDLRRAEIELARLKIAAGGVERHELAIVTPDDAAKAAREVFGSPSALEAHGPDEASPQAVAGDVLPVPDPLDH